MSLRTLGPQKQKENDKQMQTDEQRRNRHDYQQKSSTQQLLVVDSLLTWGKKMEELRLCFYS